MSGGEEKERLLRGIGIGEGVACAPLVFFEKRGRRARERRAADAAAERARLKEATAAVRARLSALEEQTRASLGEAEAEIFSVHAMLLEDEDFAESVGEAISRGATAEAAVEHATHAQAERLRATGDPYLSARARDLEDLCHQLLSALDGEEDAALTRGGGGYLLVAEDLLPSETVTLDRSRILGFLLTGGSPTSHTAILARAMGIPALVGVGKIDASLRGAIGLLDAREGTLRVHPSSRSLAEFDVRREEEAERIRRNEALLRASADRPALTGSGRRILVYANVGDVREAEAAISYGAEGIGLLRSELLYLTLDRYPTEDELAECYREIVEGMRGKRVVVRTLDVGADKQASYFSLPQEENPALGFRGIRVCLARKEVFKTQLRAILRASAYGKASLMLPMIVSLKEVRTSRKLLWECMEELDGERVAYDKKIELGVMIETPAAAIMCEELAREVDFFSVGTNDLAQYTLAADRQNPLVSHLCEENREPILRLISHAAEAIHRTGGWIGICGELAGDPTLTERFAELGIDELSVSPPYLPRLRQSISECQ